MFCRALRLPIAAAFAVAFAVPSPTPAHQGEAADELPAMDCDHPPSRAVGVLPEPVAQWTRLDCGLAGQLLMQGEGWVWHYPASWTDQVRIPAWLASHDGSGPRYFVSLSVQEHSGTAAARMDEQFARTLPNYRSQADEASKPTKALTLAAENDLGHKLQVNFVYRSDDDIWGVACAPDCNPEHVFHVYRSR